MTQQPHPPSTPTHGTRRVVLVLVVLLVLAVGAGVYFAARSFTSRPAATSVATTTAAAPTTAGVTSRPAGLDRPAQQACSRFLAAIQDGGQDIGTESDRVRLADTVYAIAQSSADTNFQATASMLPYSADQDVQLWRAAAAIFMETCNGA